MMNRFYPFRKEELAFKFVPVLLFSLLFALMFYLNVFQCLKLSKTASITMLALLSYFALNFLSAMIYLIFFDPGYVGSESCQAGEATQKYCEFCALFKPEGTHHCSVCNKCVRRYDHHCDVIKQCIGQYSLPYFLKFFLSAVIFLLVSAVVGGLSWYSGLLSQMFTVASAALAVVLALICGSLVWDPVFRNMTQVDELQNQPLQDRGIMHNSFLTLGVAWPLWMLLPFALFWPNRA